MNRRVLLFTSITLITLLFSVSGASAQGPGPQQPWRLTGNTGTNPAVNFLGTTDNVDLVVRTNNQEQVRLTGVGNVGIGTANPLERLHVGGTLRLDGSVVCTGCIGSNGLADGAVTQNKLTANSVDTGKIVDGSVSTPDLADGAVTSGKIADSAIGTTDIADGTVTQTKLAANSVDASKLIDGSVDTAELADGAVTSGKIADGSVSATDLTDGAVTQAKLAGDSVDTSKIVNGSIKAADVDSTQIQQRITGNCTIGEAIQTVNQDGTVSCGGSGIPVGLIALFTSSGCPSGWTRVAELDGKFLVGGATYNPAAGGSNTHTHGTGSYTASNHTHTVPHNGWSMSPAVGDGSRLSGGKSSELMEMANADNVTGAGSSGALTGTSASADSRPEFATVLLCRKD